MVHKQTFSKYNKSSASVAVCYVDVKARSCVIYYKTSNMDGIRNYYEA